MQKKNKELQRRIFKVSEIAQQIKSVLTQTFAEVWVEGEVSNFKAHTSGHLYFSLKDEGAVLSAAMFAWANKGLKFKLEDGMKVVCFGRIDAYLQRSQFQIIVEKVEPQGLGALQLALEQLKQKLSREGLFAAERKRPIPYLPSRIGIVTSSSGAAINDILKVLDRRFSDVQVIFRPAQVQGEGAKEDIAEAIKELNSFNECSAPGGRIEVMIVGRGGGSMEDLWAFNEEVVARAIYASKIPVISAVGHEQDWTIADLAADLRAATPSVAAELVTPKKEELKSQLARLRMDLARALSESALELRGRLEDIWHRMDMSIEHIFELSSGACNLAAKKLLLLNPLVLLQQYYQKTADKARQIEVRMLQFLKVKTLELSKAAEKLENLSPLNILGRGYSITFKHPEGAVIKDIRDLSKGDKIKTRVHKGEVLSEVINILTK